MNTLAKMFIVFFAIIGALFTPFFISGWASSHPEGWIAKIINLIF